MTDKTPKQADQVPTIANIEQALNEAKSYVHVAEMMADKAVRGGKAKEWVRSRISSINDQIENLLHLIELNKEK